jgi:hypothetical protein
MICPRVDKRVLIAALAFALLAGRRAVAQQPAPLALHPDNPHSLLLRGKPAVLVGSGEHYGALLNAAFDYVAYLDEIRSAGLNQTRAFSGVYCEAPGDHGITNNTLAPGPGELLCPFARSDAPGYANGGNKFDLTTWDEAYFKRLKDFIAQAGRRGIVVELVFFCPFYADTQWRLSPFNAKNNVNGIGDVPSKEVYTLKHPPLLVVQRALVRKIAAELKDADALYYEICNEPYFGGVTIEWQHAIADAIVEAEKDFARKHLIAQNIANGKAKIEKPHPAVSIFNFHYATPPDAVGMNWGLDKVIADDETGFKGQADFTYRREGWEFLLAGGAIYSHLDYSFSVEHPKGTYKYPPKQPGGGGAALRKQLRLLKEFIEGFDFIHMKPDAEVLKGGVPKGGAARVLANPGVAYAVYLRGGNQATLTLDVPAGRYRVEWVNTLTGAVDKSEEVLLAGGALAMDSPAYPEDVALRVVKP